MKACTKMPAFFILAIIFSSSNCKKEPAQTEFYYRCKVDGRDYRPNSCANCLTCTVLGDTVFLSGANRDFEAVAIEIKGDPLISNKTYMLDDSRNGAAYKNSTSVNDRFDTDSLRKGELNIFSINRNAQIIEGSFSFQGYNPVQDKVVQISRGQFRLKYTTN